MNYLKSSYELFEEFLWIIEELLWILIVMINVIM